MITHVCGGTLIRQHSVILGWCIGGIKVGEGKRGGVLSQRGLLLCSALLCA